MVRRKFTLGTIARLEVVIRDSANALTDVDSVLGDVLNPDGTNNVADAVFTRASLGTYYYDFQSSDIDPAGVYTVKITATAGSKVSKKNIAIFEFRDEVDA